MCRCKKEKISQRLLWGGRNCGVAYLPQTWRFRASLSGKPLWVERFRVWSRCASLSVGISMRRLPESLDRRGIKTSICGKLALDKPFRRLICPRQRRIVKFRISNVFTGVCRVGHFLCNLLLPQSWPDFLGVKACFCTGFYTGFVDNSLPRLQYSARHCICNYVDRSNRASRRTHPRKPVNKRGVQREN